MFNTKRITCFPHKILSYGKEMIAVRTKDTLVGSSMVYIKISDNKLNIISPNKIIFPKINIWKLY